MAYLKKIISALSLAILLAVSVPNSAMANEEGTERGDDIAVVFDVSVLRPIGLVATLAGLLLG